MKSTIRNLTGQRFGAWEVIGSAKPASRNRPCWTCRCQCGREKAIREDGLINGTSSGCLRCRPQSRSMDLTGMKFYRWTVLFKSEKENTRKRKPFWECQCDCGQQRQLDYTQIVSGKTKSCGCLARELASARRGEASPAWKGGRTRTGDGYIRLRIDNVEKAEHVWVMEHLLGRTLSAKETVHHKNGIRDDNRPENLELWASRQPGGQRVEDLIAWAKALLAEYDPAIISPCCI